MNAHLRTFYILAITQIISIIGSSMTSFVIGIRVFSDTGNSTPLLYASLFTALPVMISGSFAGVFVDRYDRRLILILADVGQAAGTTYLLYSFLTDNFQLWQLYTVSFLTGICGMFQRPAMEASVGMLVPTRYRDRANVIRQVSGPAAGVLAPVISGSLYTILGVTGIMIIDLVSFFIAISVVCMVRIPNPTAGSSFLHRKKFLTDLRVGFHFLRKRKILFYLMVYAVFINFLLHGPMTLTTPYILTLTGSEQSLGFLLGGLNLGIVVGGVIMLIWGGTRPRIHGIMLGLLFRAVWLIVLGLVRTPLLLGMSLFFIFFTTPLVDASFMSVLQLKVRADMQGRIFALLFQMMYIAVPLSLLITGPLVDTILEPAVAGPGWQLFTPLVGNQPGSGMGLLFFIAGVLMLIVTACVYNWQKVRNIENIYPDADTEYLHS